MSPTPVIYIINIEKKVWIPKTDRQTEVLWYIVIFDPYCKKYDYLFKRLLIALIAAIYVLKTVKL